MKKELRLLKFAGEAGLPEGSVALVYINADIPFDPKNPAIMGQVAIFVPDSMPLLISGCGNALDQLGALTDKEKEFFGAQGEQMFAVVLPEDGDGTSMQTHEAAKTLIIPEAPRIHLTEA